MTDREIIDRFGERWLDYYRRTEDCGRPVVGILLVLGYQPDAIRREMALADRAAVAEMPGTSHDEEHFSSIMTHIIDDLLAELSP